jgi:DNA polymerase-3 subunit delta'
LLKIDKYYDCLSWLETERARLEALAASGRCPHAVLVHGPAGTGRRQLAIWLCEALLGCSLASIAETEPGADIHPDLAVVEPEPDKRAIGIEQIRELIEIMSLTSHQGASRCAIIWPAEAMTVNAANSLLKTLEEPARAVVLILICETIGRLPATVVSRCQRFRITPPPASAGLAWLTGEAGAAADEKILEFAGGGPLAALELCDQDFPAMAAGFERDLADLSARRTDPVSVAAGWSKEPELALRWLYGFTAAHLRAAVPQDRARLAGYFRQLDQIRELRRFIGGSVNAELGLTELLTDWYGAGHAGET